MSEEMRAEYDFTGGVRGKYYRRYHMITDEQLANWFTHHPPQGMQAEQYAKIRQAGRFFAEVIRDNTPASADQTYAIRLVRMAVMTANAAIACEGQ